MTSPVVQQYTDASVEWARLEELIFGTPDPEPETQAEIKQAMVKIERYIRDEFRALLNYTEAINKRETVLRTQNAHLQRNNAQLQRDLDTSNAGDGTPLDARGPINSIRQSFRGLVPEVDKLITSNVELQAELTSLKRPRPTDGDEEDENQDCPRKLRQMRTNFAASDDQVRILTQDLATARADLQTAGDKVTALEATSLTLRGQLQTTQQHLNIVTAERDTAERVRDLRQAGFERVTAEVEALNRRITLINAGNRIIGDSQSKLIKERDALQQRLDSIQAPEALRNCLDRTATLEQEAAIAAQKLATLTGERDQLQAEAKTEGQNLAAVTAARHRLQAQFDALPANLQVCMDRVADLQQQLDGANYIGSEQDEIDRLNAEVARLNEAVNTITAERDNLQTQLDANTNPDAHYEADQETVNKINASYTSLTAELQRKLDDCSERNESSPSNSGAKEDVIKFLKEEIKRLRDAEYFSRAAVGALEFQNQRLQRKSKNTAQELSRAKENLALNRARLIDLERQL
jgi:chromosome segregation ATPase